MEASLEQLSESIASVEAILVENREKQKGFDDKFKSIPGDIKDAEDRIIADLTPKIVDRQELEQRLSALTETLDSLATRMERLSIDGGTTEEAISAHSEAFTDYIIHGEESEKYQAFMKSEEWRDLSESNAVEGGFLVDPVIETEIIIATITEISPIRQIARVTNITKKELNLKRRVGTPTAAWIGETGTSARSSSSYGELTIPVHAMDVYTRATRDFLQDVPGAETEIVRDAAEDMGQVEGLAFVTGDAVNKPEGFITNADINVITGADAATDVINEADFATMLTTLKNAYWTGATWVFNQTVLGSIMKLVDSNGQFIWQPGLQVGIPQMIMGLPYIIAQDMASEANAAKPLALGNFQRGYRIVDRSGVEVTRDPFSAKPDVEFLFRKRVGGKVTIPEAFQILIV